MNRIKQAIIMGLLYATPALAGYDIESAGSSSGTIFQRLIQFMQDLVDLMDGPVAICVLILGVVVALCLWIFAPDNRHLNKAVKAVAAAFIMFDMGLLITYLRT